MPPQEDLARDATIRLAATRRVDLGIAVAVAFLCALVYVATHQTHYWGDGRRLVGWAEIDAWRFAKPAYLPLYHLLALPARWFGIEETVPVLLALSIGSGALAAGCVYLAARAQGSRRASALGASALLATTPSIWFFSTSIEVHAPHLLAAAIGALWVARARARGTLGSRAWPIVALLGILGATHPTGAFWAPAAALLLLVRAKRRVREVLVLAAGLAVLLYAFRAAGPERAALDTSAEYVIERSLAMLNRWSVGGLWLGLGAGAGALTAAAVAWILLRPWRRRPDLLPLLLPIAVAVLPFLAILPGHLVYERGAHFLGVLPLFALGAAGLLDRLRPAALALVAGLPTLLSGAFALHEIDEWHTAYLGNEWIEELKRDTDDRGLIFTRHATVMTVIARHSEMFPATLGERSAPPVEMIVGQLDDGRRLAVTRDLWENAGPGQRRYLDQLVQALGEPVPGARSEYLLFPAAPR